MSDRPGEAPVYQRSSEHLEQPFTVVDSQTATVRARSGQVMTGLTGTSQASVVTISTDT
jgi:hypothetical protein